MTSYTVHKILTHNSLQLLLIQDANASISIAVYNEHTGTTVMRMTTPTLDEFERAIALIRNTSV